MGEERYEETTIRVVLADDHPAMRAGIRAILDATPDTVVVAEVGDGNATRNIIANMQPEVLLLDLHMPGPRPAQTVQWIRKHYPETAVLVLTAHNRDAYLSAMIAAGAVGFIAKEEAPEIVVSAVRKAALGGLLFSSEQLARARRWQDEVGRQWELLTDREKDVLALLAQFRTDTEIGDMLGISEKTVGHHVQRILRKLRAPTRREAGRWAMEHQVEL